MTRRTSARVALSVWKALILREALYRLFASRAAWVWLLMEPVVHVVFLMILFTVVRLRVIGGIETPLWIMVGLLAFFMFKRTGMQAMNAVSANQALFAYRQVKPVDTVLTRAALEGFLTLLVSIILFSGAGLFGIGIAPADPLAVFEAFLGLWLLGLGFGLTASVASGLVQELGRLITLIMIPLYFLSGVIFPIARVPLPYREWLMLNPIAHGLEGARLGFAPYYHAVPELSIPYLYGCALGSLFFGLALHTRYALRLATK